MTRKACWPETDKEDRTVYWKKYSDACVLSVSEITFGRLSVLIDRMERDDLIGKKRRL